MNILEKRKLLKNKIFSLQDEVSRILSIDNDVDKFLDNSNILDEWEEIIPDAEYGIFVMAILNNVKRESIIDKILDSIFNIDESNFRGSSTENNNISNLSKKYFFFLEVKFA